MITATYPTRKDSIRGYPIPVWCKMSIDEHLDGMGGCWSLSYGVLMRAKEPKKICDECEYYKEDKQ